MQDILNIKAIVHMIFKIISSWIIKLKKGEKKKKRKLREIKTLNGHSGNVHSVTINSSGKYIISGSSDNTIKIWRLKTGEEVRKITENCNFPY